MEGEVRQVGASAQVAFASRRDLQAEKVGQQIGVGQLLVGRGVESAVEDVGGVGQPKLAQVEAGLLERDHGAPSPTSAA